MFSSALRSSLRQNCRPQRASVSILRASRANISTGARVPKHSGGIGRSVWVPLAVGTLTLSSGLLFNGTVRLDADEDQVTTKVKPKRKAKRTQKEQPTSDTEASSKPEEVMNAREEEARAGTASSSPASEGESSADGNDDASNGGAFNPETGEINWDCPCLGGMAHGPCGQEFRDAFSCFVFSEEEPKGINCVEKFKAMQDCFRRHPEVYGEEIMSEDDDEDNGDASSPSGTDSPPLKGEPIPDPDPVAVPPSGFVSPSQ